MSFDRILTLMAGRSTELLPIAIQRGAIPGLSGNVSFAGIDGVGQTFETVWRQGGLYEYPSAPTTMTVSSTSANDTAAGTGARTVVVSGLVDDFEAATETVSLSGQTPVTVPGNWIRINRITADDVGSLTVNDGDMHVGEGTVTSGVPATTYGFVGAGDGTSLSSVFTFAKGTTGYGISSVYYGGKGDEVEARLFLREPGKSFRVVTEVRCFQNQSSKERALNFVEVPEKTDVEIRARAIAGNIDVFAYHEALIVDESDA